MTTSARTLVLGALIAGGVAVVVRARSDAFDAEVWRSQKGVLRNNQRAGMLIDLERKHLRVGMRRDEVEGLLGAPDRREPSRDRYELGISPVGIDFEWYVIDYDEANRVSQFRLDRG